MVNRLPSWIWNVQKTNMKSITMSTKNPGEYWGAVVTSTKALSHLVSGIKKDSSEKVTLELR